MPMTRYHISIVTILHQPNNDSLDEPTKRTRSIEFVLYKCNTQDTEN